MSDFIRVANLDEVPVGTRRLLILAGQPVVLFNVSGQFFCIADMCTHDGGPLAEGDLTGYAIECPRHGARFDIKNGTALSFPATAPVPIYQVKIDGNDILIRPT